MVICSSQHAFCLPCGEEAHGPCSCSDWQRWCVLTHLISFSSFPSLPVMHSFLLLLLPSPLFPVVLPIPHFHSHPLQTIACDFPPSTLSSSLSLLHTHTHTLSLTHTHSNTLVHEMKYKSTSNLFNTPSLCALSAYVPSSITCYTTQAEEASRRNESSWTDARRRLKGWCDSYRVADIS
jgi:hypothetical protein